MKGLMIGGLLVAGACLLVTLRLRSEGQAALEKSEKTLTRLRLANQERHSADLLAGKIHRRLSEEMDDLVHNLSIVKPQPFTASSSVRQVTTAHDVACVSIAALGDEGFFCCDYNDVFFFDSSQFQMVRLAKPILDGKWNPTGLACPAGEQTLLVANYLGGDVLEFAYESGKLVLRHRYQCPGMGSPEGVAVSKDGRLVSVADYDGSRLWVFDRHAGLRWGQPLEYGHGVAMGEGCVYATSLGHSGVVKHDLSGKEIKRVGSVGWADGHYLWPTSVFADEIGVIVSDAHTGKITHMDHDLESVASIGGNGPGWGLMSMPYCTIRHRGKFWVCDTFKRRILCMTPKGDINIEISHRPSNFSLPLVPLPERMYWTAVDLSYGLDLRLPQFPTGSWFPSYGGFMQYRKQPGDWRAMNLPAYGQSLLDVGSFTYFTWMHRVTHENSPMLIMGCTNYSTVFVIDPIGRCASVSAGDLPLHSSGTRLYHSDGSLFDATTVLQKAGGSFARHDSLLSDKSMTLLMAARLSYWPEMDEEQFGRRLQAGFQTDDGRRFLHSFLEAHFLDDQRAAAAKFDTAVDAMINQVPLAELWLRNILVPRALPSKNADPRSQKS